MACKGGSSKGSSKSATTKKVPFKNNAATKKSAVKGTKKGTGTKKK